MPQFILVQSDWNYFPRHYPSLIEYHYHRVHVCHMAKYEISGRSSKQPMEKDLILSSYLTHRNATKTICPN